MPVSSESTAWNQSLTTLLCLQAFAHFFNAFGLSAEEFLTKHLGKAKAILQYHIVPNIDSPETLTDSAVPLDTLLGSKKLFAAGKVGED